MPHDQSPRKHGMGCDQVIKLATTGSEVRHVTNCAMRPGIHNLHLLIITSVYYNN